MPEMAAVDRSILIRPRPFVGRQQRVSTQILEEAGFAKDGKIAVTQPRRVVRLLCKDV